MKSIVHAVLRRVDKILGVPGDYLHFILDESWAAFFRFLSFMRFANFRKRLPKDAWHIARIMSTQAVDCGTCVGVTRIALVPADPDLQNYRIRLLKLKIRYALYCR